ncbi:MAG: ABC transporter permease [Burkholderiales bacterium]|nr:ABC transporter permease [Anaerolineae bacterium]
MTSTVSVQSQPVQRYREKSKGFLLAVPAMVWLSLFFVLPLLIVLVVSFLTRGQGGVGTMPFTLANYQRVADVFIGILGDSVWVAFATTIICLLVGYPMAFFISTRQNPRARQLALFLIILPFWTNFLVRTYALQTILGREGTLNTFLMNTGLIAEPLGLLNTQGAVLLGLVYGFLPFMVLPIYASAERFEFRFVEAAHDLGANDWFAFWRIVLPLTLPGVVAGCILVFIPAIGSFVTPDLLGGTRGIMIGNLITQQFRGSGNQPLGSALSIVMMLMVMIALLVYIRFGEQRD